jgi:protein SCO1
MLAAIPGLSLAAHSAFAAHDPFGPVKPPRPSPSMWLLRDDGARVEMRQHLLGKITAVQLMFTSCSATCPLQGALFASVTKRLRNPNVQLLSLSIDPTTDTPAALGGWLKRFGATKIWRAASPTPDDLDRMLNFFRGRAEGADRHTAQVYLFDEQARLIFSTAEMPTAKHLSEIIAVASTKP